MAVYSETHSQSAITTAATYTIANRQDAPDMDTPVIAVLVEPTTVTTNFIVSVAVSVDGTKWDTIYTSTTSTAAAAWKRIIFSGSGSASDTDSATVGSTINKSPILEPLVQVTITPSGAYTGRLTVMQLDTTAG